MQIKVINLDGCVAAQPALSGLIASGLASCIEARDLAGSTRIVARKRMIERFVQRVGTPPENRTELVFYGSGDFHHLSAALISRHVQPLTVIHFDNHPDWVRFPATFNCGAWVNRALEMSQVKRVITLGPCSDDLENPERKTANLEAVKDGRLVVFPWLHAPSRVNRDFGSGQAHEQRDGMIHWRNLADENWDSFLTELLANIPTEAIYITIDKDVLGTGEATTNWDQGQMTLAHVVSAIEALGTKFQVLGVDVCGDYSAPRFKDPFRFALAYFDHPKTAAPDEQALAINSATNQKLLNCFAKVFS